MLLFLDLFGLGFCLQSPKFYLGLCENVGNFEFFIFGPRPIKQIQNFLGIFSATKWKRVVEFFVLFQEVYCVSL